MTLVIGIHLKEFVILAADTRVTHGFGDDEKEYTDEHNKIQDIGIGLMTGSGYTDLLDVVKDRVSNTVINNTDQIRDIITEERAAIERDEGMAADLKKYILDATGWMFSYTTIEDSQPVLRLAVMHPSFDHEWALVLANTATPIVPNDLPDDISSEIPRILNPYIKTLDEIPDYQANANHNVSMISVVMKKISQIAPSVSPSFHIGIHFLDGRKQISDIINAQEPDER